MSNPLDRLRDAVVRVAHIGKLKLDVSFLRRERDELVQRLGEVTFDLLERRDIPEPPALHALVEAIRAIDAKRDEGLRTADAIRNELTAEPTKT